MKFIRNIAFTLATFIVLLHAVVPHEHHQGQRNVFTVHQKPASLFEQIALGFHLSQTDGHLENFSTESATSQLNQQQLVAILSVLLLEIHPLDLQPVQEKHIEPDPSFKSLNVGSLSHRGPPII